MYNTIKEEKGLLLCEIYESRSVTTELPHGNLNKLDLVLKNFASVSLPQVKKYINALDRLNIQEGHQDSKSLFYSF